MLDYFVASDFAHHVRLNLMAYIMGPCRATEYIDKFQKYLVNFPNVSKPDAKCLFEVNLVDW